MKNPGITPPRKTRPADSSAMLAYITMMMLGGMMGPMHELAAVTAAEKGLS